jgi:hypothetical protein
MDKAIWQTYAKRYYGRVGFQNRRVSDHERFDGNFTCMVGAESLAQRCKFTEGTFAGLFNQPSNGIEQPTGGVFHPRFEEELADCHVCDIAAHLEHCEERAKADYGG